MTRDSIIQLSAAGVLLASLGASVWTGTEVAASAGRHKLGYADRAEDSDPPEVGLGIAMGAFRGIFVNYLWLRANKAKDKGNYYEAIDLAKTITKLQPRFPRVWAFHAWNMSYNISVATNTAEERWQWVNAGIRLLRDEAIPANPNDLLVHKELAWIFVHKVQGTMDDANQTYKSEFAREWTIVLGAPPRPDPKDRSRERALNDYLRWLGRIAEARDTMQEVVKAAPAAATIASRLKADAGLDVENAEDRLKVLEVIEVGRALARLQSGLANANVPSLAGPVVTLLSDQSLFPGWEALVPHLRKRALVDTYHMEPDRMVAYTRRFGPMDWRHAAAHAVYWAQRGVDEAQGRVFKENEADFDFLNTDRVVIQSIQDLYRSGTLHFDVLKPQYYLALPNVHFVPTYRTAMMAMLDREQQQFLAQRNADIRNNPFNLYRSGYQNFMCDAIAFLYRRGEKEPALRLKEQLLADFINNKKNPLLNWNDPGLEDMLKLPLEEFVVEQVKERITSPDIARAEVYGSLYDAFTALLNDDRDLFNNAFSYAARFHDAYMKEQYRQVGVDPTKARMEVMPKDWIECATLIFASILNHLGAEEASMIYARVPDDRLRCMAYDEMSTAVKPGMDEDAKKGRGPTFDSLFPKPPGLAEYLATKAARATQAPKKAESEQK